MFFSDTCSSLKLPAVSVHIQKAVWKCAKWLRRKSFIKIRRGLGKALALVAWIVHKCIYFLGNVRLFFPRFISVHISHRHYPLYSSPQMSNQNLELEMTS